MEFLSRLAVSDVRVGWPYRVAVSVCVSVSVLAMIGSVAFASGEDLEVDEHEVAVKEQAKSLCYSTNEYIHVLKFLRETKDLAFPERTSRLIAEKVSRGCDGSASRFEKVLMLLRKVGLSDAKALAMALDFSSQTPDVQKNFTEIFTKSYLSEFFDYDYPAAARLAYELSRDYQGDPVQVREDFIELVRYCKDKKTLDLPNRLCAELTIKLAHLSQYFPDGIRGPFHKLFTDLREKKEFMLDMRTALDVSYNVLKNGPSAPENFYSAYKFATDKDGLDMSQRQAMAFAIKMADRSFVGGDHPPAIAAPTPGPLHVAAP